MRIRGNNLFIALPVFRCVCSKLQNLFFTPRIIRHLGCIGMLFWKHFIRALGQQGLSLWICLVAVQLLSGTFL